MECTRFNHRACVVALVVFATVVLSVASGSATAIAAAPANGRVKIVYDEGKTEPDNQQLVEKLKKSRALEQLANWLNTSVALPHDLVVKVTDDVPPGVTDMVTQPDGRTIYIPPAFLRDVAALNTEVVQTVERPELFPERAFNVDDLNALSAQFIFGHEIGHALQRQLVLPHLGLEEDAADGFAIFYTVNEHPDATVAGALLFDAIARKEGTPTLEGLSSDHAVTQQRAFNFLCLLDGSDPEKYDGALVDAGYVPKSRAPLCAPEWAALNYGWWSQLQPSFREAFKKQGANEQKKGRAELIAATKAFAEKIDELRTSQAS
jgi:hypothetical protein